MNRIWISIAALLVHLVASTSTADAAVTKEGRWPQEDKLVTIDVDGVSRSTAVKKLADAAGWSVIVPSSLALNGGNDSIDVHMKNQPASKVLELILADGTFVATRDENRVSLKRADAASAALPGAAPTPPVPGMPPIPPVPPMAMGQDSDSDSDSEAHEAKAGAHHSRHGKRGEDRTVTGHNLTIGKDETVNDVVVLGGSLDVYGHVTGDISVTGGSLHIHDGAHVEGDATAIGGSVVVDDKAEVEGDVDVMGGSVKRGDRRAAAAEGAEGHKKDPGDHEDEPNAEGLKDRFVSAGSAVTRSAFLFIFGAILLALATARMETLRVEVAARPMRSFAIGVLGCIAAVVITVVLCVTLIGIPVVLFAIPIAVFASYAGLVAVLSTVGEALLRHRTKNPYLHLAAGCVLLLVVGSLPWIGGAVTAIASILGIGIIVATRGAGILPNRTNSTPSPAV